MTRKIQARVGGWNFQPHTLTSRVEKELGVKLDQ